MKLPKKWGAHRRRNPSQRRVDDEFLDITSRLDDTDIFSPGPRDYELAEPDDRFQPPILPATPHPRRAVRVLAITIVVLIAWVATYIAGITLPFWLHMLGFLDLSVFCALLIYLRPRGRSALTDKWGDDNGARV
ncbi:hypothetical protein [Varibaculum vaginae]|uniref:hypothetical protein n=1 Tax=Varibaculum vaginae TaxID=2364797 RepID=UPI000F08E735|nr:hypothetical protein [Varibaculum vaginae]